MNDPTLPLSGLSSVCDKSVVARFDGGMLSSNGAVPALAEVEKRLRVADRVARCNIAHNLTAIATDRDHVWPAGVYVSIGYGTKRVCGVTSGSAGEAQKCEESIFTLGPGDLRATEGRTRLEIVVTVQAAGPWSTPTEFERAGRYRYIHEWVSDPAAAERP